MVSTRESDGSDVVRRIGSAWRELRRGWTTQPMRARLYGELPRLEVGQVDALDVLASSGEVRMGDLAGALRVDPSTATRGVDRLVKAGLAERVGAAGDGRGVSVRVSDEGRALQAQLADRRRAFLVEALEAFEPEEQAQLAALLERLVGRADELLARD